MYRDWKKLWSNLFSLPYTQLVKYSISAFFSHTQFLNYNKNISGTVPSSRFTVHLCISMFTAAFNLPLISHSTLIIPILYLLFAESWDFGEQCLWQGAHWTLRPKYIKRPTKIYWRHSLFRHRLIYASMASARTIVTPRMPFAAIRICSRVPLPPFCPVWTLPIARYVCVSIHTQITAPLDAQLSALDTSHPPNTHIR